MAMVAAVTATPGPVAPVPFLTNRLGSEAGIDTPVMGPAADGDRPTTAANYLTIAFNYNPEANKLIMLFRDRNTGDTISQIPSEVALKYEALARHHSDDKNQPAASEQAGLNGKDNKGDNGAATGAVSSSPETGDGFGAQKDSGGAGSFHDPSKAPAVAAAVARFNIVV